MIDKGISIKCVSELWCGCVVYVAWVYARRCLYVNPARLELMLLEI